MCGMQRALCLLLVFSFVFLSFSHDADARRRRRHRAKRQKIINEKKLYERIGGSKTVSDMVDEWLRLNLADSRVSGSFSSYTAKPERLGRLRRSLGDQICEIADGPCSYKGSDTKRVKDGAAFSDDQFLIVSDNLFRSMQKLGLAEREKDELLSRLGDLRPDILGDPGTSKP
jgi:hemoglobin